MRRSKQSTVARALGLLVALMVVPTASMAQVPHDMAYQGRLTDAVGAPLTGPVFITLRLFDVISGGVALYSEDHPAVALDDTGAFSVRLGTGAGEGGGPPGVFNLMLFVGVNRYLEVELDGEVLAPRQPIGSVPWALIAEAAHDVAGYALTDPSTEIGNALVSESVLRETADAGHEAAILFEAATREDADQGQTAGISNNATAISENTMELNAEATARAAADGVHNAAIAANATAVTGEVGARAAADVALQTNLDLEVATRATADTALQAAVDGAVAGHTVNTDTQLTNSQVKNAAIAEGFVTGAHTVNTDTQLTETQVDTYVANNDYSTGAHTVNTDTQLTETQVDTYVANNNYSTGAHTVDTNTTYSAGAGLILTGTTLTADPSVLQGRVSSECPPGSSIRKISVLGAVVCETDTDSPPQMTSADRDLIGNPATGLIIFNTETNCLQVNLSSQWHDLACATVDLPCPYTEDFASYGDQSAANTAWPTSDSGIVQVDVGNQTLAFTHDGNQFQSSTHALGYQVSVSDTYWKLRFKLTITNFNCSANYNHGWHVGLSDSDYNTSANQGQDFIGMLAVCQSAERLFRMADSNNNDIEYRSRSSVGPSPGNGTYYVEIIRESATSYKVEFFSDSSYSGSLGSNTQLIDSSLTDLKYIVWKGSWDQRNESAGYVDDIEFWDGSCF